MPRNHRPRLRSFNAARVERSLASSAAATGINPDKVARELAREVLLEGIEESHQGVGGAKADGADGL